jgi:hypothetical protein
MVVTMIYQYIEEAKGILNIYNCWYLMVIYESIAGFPV